MSARSQTEGVAFDLARYAGLGLLFIFSAFFVGLVVACFVPPEWVISAEDVAFLQSHPHGVVDLSEDYQKLLDGRPMSAERHRQLRGHLRQLWFSYWLRWGALSLLFGAIVAGVERTLGTRAMAIMVGLSAAGLVLFIVLYLLSHPGFDPFY